MALGPRSNGSAKKPRNKSVEIKLDSNGAVKSDEKPDTLTEDDPLLKRLHTIVEHQEELLKKQNSSDDWHAVATIIDRLVSGGSLDGRAQLPSSCLRQCAWGNVWIMEIEVLNIWVSSLCGVNCGYRKLLGKCFTLIWRDDSVTFAIPGVSLLNNGVANNSFLSITAALADVILNYPCKVLLEFKFVRFQQMTQEWIWPSHQIFRC